MKLVEFVLLMTNDKIKQLKFFLLFFSWSQLEYIRNFFPTWEPSIWIISNMEVGSYRICRNLLGIFDRKKNLRRREKAKNDKNKENDAIRINVKHVHIGGYGYLHSSYWPFCRIVCLFVSLNRMKLKAALTFVYFFFTSYSVFECEMVVAFAWPQHRNTQFAYCLFKNREIIIEKTTNIW